MTLKFIFEEKLRELERIQNRKIALEEVADFIGISRQAVSDWTRKPNKAVKLETLDALCDFFNCEVGDLFVRTPNKRH